MTRRPAAAASLLVLVVLGGAPAAAAAQAGPSPSTAAHAAAPPPSADSALTDVSDLPLVEVPAAHRRPTREIALLITGDGGWAALDRGVAARLAAAGVPVVGLDARAYLSKPRDPDDAGRDVGRVLRSDLRRWGSDRAVLVGYSRGADLLPFVANRLPADIRREVVLLAMLGLGERASFKFHWLDLLRDRSRPQDLPIAPELARLRGTRMLCVYGSDERESGCRTADPTLITKVERKGGHHFDGNVDALGDLILGALPE